MQLNKVHHVRTLARLAAELGEDEDWLCEVANGMEIEDGVIWVYGLGEEECLALSDDGVERLQELIELYKANPDLLRRPE